MWLTPLLRNGRLRGQIQEWGGSSLFVIGDNDPHDDPTLLHVVKAPTGGEVPVIAGGDHILEVEGDVWRSLDALLDVLRAIESFTR